MTITTIPTVPFFRVPDGPRCRTETQPHPSLEPLDSTDPWDGTALTAPVDWWNGMNPVWAPGPAHRTVTRFSGPGVEFRAGRRPPVSGVGDGPGQEP